jgi:hypothetical protein
MWELKDPKPVKLIVGILAADSSCLQVAIGAIEKEHGAIDLVSDIWPFDKTDYYKEQAGASILRQFVSLEKLIDPDKLSEIKLQTNEIEEKLAGALERPLPRPVNLDPGIIEPSKLILATTKNYSHRIYIGNRIYAEVTLIFHKGTWRHLEYTYPDYRQECYFAFFNKVRAKLIKQLGEL